MENNSILQSRCMQQYAVDCLLHVVIVVYRVLHFSVSLRQCSTFVSILCQRALGKINTCMVGVGFACVCCGVSIYALYLDGCAGIYISRGWGAPRSVQLSGVKKSGVPD